MGLEKLVGRMLVLGIGGTEVTDADVRRFRATRAGGLILFTRNFSSPNELARLIHDFEEALERRLLVMVDHEGGRVVRFHGGVTLFPSNMTLGSVGKRSYARDQGGIAAVELRRLGVDVNLSPVLDVVTQRYSPNIGVRSYGRDPELVAALGAARIEAMQAAGVSACAKHFPGSGPAGRDAHLGLPVIETGRAEIEKIHLPPFSRAIDAGVDMIMSSHPLYPGLDPGPRRPATFSKAIMTDLLRGDLGYEGVTASDDLEMGAIGELCAIGEAAVRAVEAGHDLVLSCHDPRCQVEVFEALVEAARGGRLAKKDLEKSSERIERLASKHPSRFAGGPPAAEPGGAKLADRICAEGLRVLRDAGDFLPVSRAWCRGRRVSVIFPRLSARSGSLVVEAPLLNEEAYVRDRMSGRGVDCEVEIIDIDPAADRIDRAREIAGASDMTILFCMDARLYPGCGKLLSEVQRAAPRLIAALLCDPYDVELVEPGAACLTAFGARECEIRALFNGIFGGIPD